MELAAIILSAFAFLFCTTVGVLLLASGHIVLGTVNMCLGLINLVLFIRNITQA